MSVPGPGPGHHPDPDPDPDHDPTSTVRFPSDALDRLARAFPGRVGIYIEAVCSEVAGGARYAFAADERFPTASVFKIPVLLTLYQLAEAGRLSLDDRHRVAADISTHGTGILKQFTDAPELSLRDHCRIMISHSDNIATDTIIRAVGLDQINAMLERQGLANTRVPMEIGRWHYVMAGMDRAPLNLANDDEMVRRAKAGEVDDDGLAFSDRLENLVASPRDLAALVGRIDQGKLAGAAATESMRQMLRLGDGPITSVLQPNVAAQTMSKRGSSRRIVCDVALVPLAAGPLVISVMTLEDQPRKSGTALIGEVTRLAVGAVDPDALAAD
ncbi:MAG: hypothetical protein CMJ18_15405 [Phycisphaeraceae bacterium]|nr:hypothetical protein [Phycisphaeraceae bacterium]